MKVGKIKKWFNRDLREVHDLMSETFTPDLVQGYKIHNRKLHDLLCRMIRLHGDIIVRLEELENEITILKNKAK